MVRAAFTATVTPVAPVKLAVLPVPAAGLLSSQLAASVQFPSLVAVQVPFCSTMAEDGVPVTSISA